MDVCILETEEGATSGRPISAGVRQFTYLSNSFQVVLLRVTEAGPGLSVATCPVSFTECLPFL